MCLPLSLVPFLFGRDYTLQSAHRYWRNKGGRQGWTRVAQPQHPAAVEVESRSGQLSCFFFRLCRILLFQSFKLSPYTLWTAYAFGVSHTPTGRRTAHGSLTPTPQQHYTRHARRAQERAAIRLSKGEPHATTPPRRAKHPPRATRHTRGAQQRGLKRPNGPRIRSETVQVSRPSWALTGFCPDPMRALAAAAAAPTPGARPTWPPAARRACRAAASSSLASSSRRSPSGRPP